MTSPDPGIALGCTSCGVDLLVTAQGEDEVRDRLAAFFAQHDGCAVFVDVSRSAAPLPRRTGR